MTLRISGMISGVEDLERTLKAFTPMVEARLLDNAMAAGARVIGAEIRRTAPVRSLRKTGVVQGRRAARKLGIAGRRSKRVAGLAFVAIQQPKSRLAHLFEFGTAPRRRKNGGFTGSMRAQPFMRPAAERSRGAVLEKVRENLRKGIARETPRMIRSGKF